MTDKVMRMTDTSINQNAFFKPVQRKCQACEEEEKHVHRKEGDGSDVQGSSELDNYVSSLGSSGQPMPEAGRKFFEPRFGYDFSKVRMHTDPVAAKSAQSINALAYTSGNNIVFNQGQYSPGTPSGQKLMAHELTHVVQQQSSKIQRAPQTQSSAPVNWWEDKGIGIKPQKQFWDDINLFFPKDGRKFSGSQFDNVTNIECDDKGIVKIGKGYWDEQDGLKRKALILPMIEIRNVKRFDEARIDNEDLTTDPITAKLKALAGADLQNYIQKLTSMSKFISNDQVIAYLNGDDNSKKQILQSANEKLLDWKFDNNRLNDNDLKDEKTNTRLRGLNTADKLDKETKARELAGKTGEDTSKLQNFLHTQTTTSTPLPDDAVLDSNGGFTMSFPNVDVIVLPDTSGGKGNETSIKHNLPNGQFSFDIGPDGLITKFFKGSGKSKTPIDFPSKLTITIQTRFADISTVDNNSAYGRGTTDQDIKWGGKTLRFHEGSHGKGYIDFIRSNSFPSLALGSVKPGDISTTTALLKKINDESCQLVDQVGITQEDYLKTPEGKKSGIINCTK